MRVVAAMLAVAGIALGMVLGVALCRRSSDSQGPLPTEACRQVCGWCEERSATVRVESLLPPPHCACDPDGEVRSFVGTTGDALEECTARCREAAALADDEEGLK